MILITVVAHFHLVMGISAEWYNGEYTTGFLRMFK
jgi:hypothetical protein